jgi:hypothetical protein
LTTLSLIVRISRAAIMAIDASVGVISRAAIMAVDASVGATGVGRAGDATVPVVADKVAIVIDSSSSSAAEKWPALERALDRRDGQHDSASGY